MGMIEELTHPFCEEAHAWTAPGASGLGGLGALRSGSFLRPLRLCDLPVSIVESQHGSRCAAC